MKVNRIKIHNFRGILEEEIFIKDYSLIVGPNNAGKSTLIDAIRCFYEKDGYKFKHERDFPYGETLDQEAWIELEFLLSDDEFASLADDYKNTEKSLKVRKYFLTELNGVDGKSLSGVIVGYDSQGKIQTSSFYGAKNVQNGKFGDIIYVPAVSKIDDHAKLTGPSALRDLVSSVLKDVVEQSTVFKKFVSDFEIFSGSIKTEKSSQGVSLDIIEKEIDEQLRDWGPKFKFTLNHPTADDMIKSLVEYEFDSNGRSQDPEQFGSGFQRQFIYSLIQAGAKYSGKKNKVSKKDFTPSLTWILFEEPEAFLHPPQQESMAYSLRALILDSNRQVLCSTHSPNFISKNSSDLTSIIRVRRHKEGFVKFYQIREEDWKTIIQENQKIIEIAKRFSEMKKKLDDDDGQADMESIKYFLWLNPDRSGLFFADIVLLVEGPTEVGMINRLVAEGKVKTSGTGVYVADCLGKYNMHRFMNLMSKMGLDHIVMHDDDNHKDEHKDLNELIQSAANKMFTKKVISIDSDFESLLGIPKTKDHRKPQHALFLYDQGRIQKEKIDLFCSKVEAAFN
jgi:putative ATP-dependent endonuclease of the OLD family